MPWALHAPSHLIFTMTLWGKCHYNQHPHCTDENIKGYWSGAGNTEFDSLYCSVPFSVLLCVPGRLASVNYSSTGPFCPVLSVNLDQWEELAWDGKPGEGRCGYFSPPLPASCWVSLGSGSFHLPGPQLWSSGTPHTLWPSLNSGWGRNWISSSSWHS